MFQYCAEFDDEFTGRRGLDVVRGFNPRLQAFKEWLTEHKDASVSIEHEARRSGRARPGSGRARRRSRVQRRRTSVSR